MNIEEIKKVQETLKLPQTGQYDEFTEAAVRNYQLKNNLPVSGVVDNTTKELLYKEGTDGFISSDLRENTYIIKKYLLKSDEYFTTEETKHWLFLHHTAGWNNPLGVVNDWETDSRGKVGTEYVIGGVNIQTLDGKYDGEIVQCMPSYKNYGWHIGIGNTVVHRASIGIELCNFGWLVKDGNYFRTYPILDSKGNVVRKGVIVNPKEIVDLKRDFRGFRYYHKYSENQIHSMKFLILKIANETGIDVTKGLKERIKNSKDPFTAFDFDPAIRDGKVKGLFCHTNVSPKNKWGNYEKWDLSPQPLVLDMILSL